MGSCGDVGMAKLELPEIDEVRTIGEHAFQLLRCRWRRPLWLEIDDGNLCTLRVEGPSYYGGCRRGWDVAHRTGCDEYSQPAGYFAGSSGMSPS